MSRRRRSFYRPSFDWISGVAFRGTLTPLDRPVEEFTTRSVLRFATGLLPHAPSRTRSYPRLVVATNSPHEGLPPPIRCPCLAHLRPVRPFLPSSAFAKVMDPTTAKRPNHPVRLGSQSARSPKNQSLRWI